MRLTPQDKLHQTVAYVRDIGRRVERRAEPKRSSDLELRHLRSLMQEYATGAGAEVLVLGDSLMYWTVHEPDRRSTFDMISDQLGADTRCIALSGAGYNARMVMAFLAGLRECPSRPRVVVVPLTLVTMMSAFLDHPIRGQAKAAAAVRSAVATWPDLPRSYEKPGADDWAAFDQLPAPSLIGQRRTMGELELFINSSSASPTQRAVRQRHIVDSYTAERLGPDSPGVGLVAEMGRHLRGIGVHAIGYMPPINVELAERVLGAEARPHILRNADVAASAFLDATRDRGTVVNEVVASPEAEFSDPLHLTQEGRHRLAVGIAHAIDAQLPGVPTVHQVVPALPDERDHGVVRLTVKAPRQPAARPRTAAAKRQVSA